MEIRTKAKLSRFGTLMLCKLVNVEHEDLLEDFYCFLNIDCIYLSYLWMRTKFGNTGNTPQHHDCKIPCPLIESSV